MKNRNILEVYAVIEGIIHQLDSLRKKLDSEDESFIRICISNLSEIIWKSE